MEILVICLIETFVLLLRTVRGEIPVFVLKHGIITRTPIYSLDEK